MNMKQYNAAVNYAHVFRMVIGIDCFAFCKDMKAV